MAWEGLNRRKFPRANFPCLIKVLRAEGSREGEKDETTLTHTENISVGGVCVIINKSYDLFAPVVIEVDLMDAGEPIFCKAKVVWSVRRKAMEGHKPFFYDVGFEFVDIKQEQRARVEHVVDHLVKHGRETQYR